MKLLEVKVGSTQSSTPNPLQIQEVFANINRELSKDSRTLWIALDELDKVAVDGTNGRNHSSELLSALMQTHSELYQLGQIRFKFFVRSDVYEGLTYVDKDHFSNAILRLKWETEDLVIMLALRIAASAGGVVNELKLSEANELVDEVFEWPQSIGGSVAQDLLEQLCDGRGSVIPRDLLNFAIAPRTVRSNSTDRGINRAGKGPNFCEGCREGVGRGKQSEACAIS